MDIPVVYINLAHRTDRNVSLRKNLEKYNFDMGNVHRLDAKLNEQCGHLGCGESHVMALKLAIKKNWSAVLILEDDFVFEQSIDLVEETFDKLANINFDVVMLSVGHKLVDKCEYNFLNRAKKCTTASAYIVRKHYYKTLLHNFEEAVRNMKKELMNHKNKLRASGKPFEKLHVCSAIDQNWFKLQQKDVFYLCDPTLGSQNCGYSDNNCSIEHQKYIIKQNAGF